jgi:uncharacterized protein
MHTLVCDGRPVATLELATSMRARMKGLLGREGIDGAILLRPASSIHTVRMRFAIDVAFVDSELTVLRTMTVPPGRVTRVVRRAKAVVEAEAGAFARWGLRPGSQLAIDERTADGG